MTCACDDHNNEIEPRDCGRCKTPMVKGHGAVCVLTWVADISFAAGIVLLLLFWAVLFMALGILLANRAANLPPFVILAPIAAVNSGLLLLLSLACSMRAKWLRHDLVSMDDTYLDDDGSCCGGSCAGSCGEAGCDEEASGDCCQR